MTFDETMKPMKTILSFLILLTFSQAIAQADTTDFQYYLSTSDFQNRVSGQEKIVPVIKKHEKDYIKISKLVDEQTGKRNKPANFPWAVKLDTTYYFNLRYSRDLQNPEVYLKADIIGKFCALIIDQDTSPIISSGGANYGGGLTGVLIKESEKWGKNWISEDGKKVKLLITDTSNLELKHGFGHSNSDWKLLFRKNINEILGLSLSEEDIKNLTLKDVKTIVLEKNNVDLQ